MKHPNEGVSCPGCGRRPDGETRRQCHCGHVWDVFFTGGRCPACFYQWEKIRCCATEEGCGSWFPYLDWYGDLEAWLATELAALNEALKQQE